MAYSCMYARMPYRENTPYVMYARIDVPHVWMSSVLVLGSGTSKWGT